MARSYRSLRFEQFEPKLLLASNQAPLVDAGRDLELPVSNVATLEGTVSDDGPLDAVDLAWVKVRGPGDVTFADPGAAQTTAQFSALGRYDVRLEANDGQLTTIDYLTINVLAASQGPVVDAGADQTALLATDVLLRGTVTDDGSSHDLMTTWVSVSGPSLVAFADPGAEDTSARFSIPGIYVLQLEADNGDVQGIDQVTITVEAPNAAPQVDAGADQIVLITDGVTLDAAITDDGLPGSVTTAWSKLSGPGTVAFGDASAVGTTATFSESGTYVLRLEASDGQLVSHDEVTFTVEAKPTPQPTPTPEPVTQEFQDGVFPQTAYSGTRDATIMSNSASTNFGSVATLDVDGNPDEATLLRWDVSQIPPGSVIQSATISIKLSDTTVRDIEIYELLHDWDEAEITWQQASSGSPWQTGGVQGNTDRGSSVLGSVVAPAPGVIDIDLTSAGIATVQSWVNNSATNYGIIIQDYDNHDGIGFDSREASTPTARPKLSVTYLANGNVGTNLAPIVDAGTDQSVLVSAVLNLDGNVWDDGLPNSATTTQWRKISGPGNVNFGDTAAVDTTASFTAAGTYVLELSANDGVSTASDRVTVGVSDIVQEVSGFFVSPNGSSNGDGSSENPWDLETAMSHPNSVKPGDTILLRGGTYRGGFSSRLTGTAEKPIVVRSYPGERVTIDIYDSNDYTQFNINGDYSHFVGLEFASTDPKPRYTDSPGFPVQVYRGSLNVNGNHVKITNSVIHDLIGGPGWSGDGGEMYGTLIYNNGIGGSGEHRYHGLYTNGQNLADRKFIVDNIIFNNTGYGIHAWGNSEQYVRNIEFRGNVTFNANAAVGQGYGWMTEIFVGSGSSDENISLIENYTYRQTNGDVTLGWSGSDKNLTLADNYFAHGELRFQTTWADITSSGNTVVGWVTGPAPNEGIDVIANPSGVKVFVEPNAYEAGRAHVAIYNWDENPSVDVDLSSILNVGASYEVHHVYDLFGEPVSSGVYNGGTIQLPMEATTAPRLLGGLAGINDPIVQGAEFGAFIVRTVSAEAQPLQAGERALSGVPAGDQLTPRTLEPILDHALTQWRAANVTSSQLATLDRVQVKIADLDGGRLGEAMGTIITLDVDAAGHGWFIDGMPDDNDEYVRRANRELVARDEGAAAAHMDLLTVVMHELGHVIGHGHDYAGDDSIMAETLEPGVRRSLDIDLLDELFTSTF